MGWERSGFLSRRRLLRWRSAPHFYLQPCERWWTWWDLCHPCEAGQGAGGDVRWWTSYRSGKINTKKKNVDFRYEKNQYFLLTSLKEVSDNWRKQQRFFTYTCTQAPLPLVVQPLTWQDKAWEPPYSWQQWRFELKYAEPQRSQPKAFQWTDYITRNSAAASYWSANALSNAACLCMPTLLGVKEETSTSDATK